MAEELTFEAIDQHVQDADLDSLEKEASQVSAESFEAQPANAIRRICEIYRVVRPILRAILQIPFIPEQWKRAIRLFIRVLDLLCR